MNKKAIPVRLYEGTIDDRGYMSKDEALRYVKDLFNREADKIDQQYNDSNNDSQKGDTLKRVNREWLTSHGFSPLEEVRKRIEGKNYPINKQ